MSDVAQENEAGFTLIEVLVALAILAISLAALMSVLATGLDRQRQVRDETTALSLARSLMAQADSATSLPGGGTHGAFPNGFTWARHVAPYGSATDAQAWGANAKEITITVSWANGARQISSLRVMPSAP
jgi:general secretion pathway protein I